MAIEVRPAHGAAEHHAASQMILAWAQDTEQAPQDVFEEVHWLPELYAPPDNALLLAWDGDQAVGLAALQVEEGDCHLRRLYVAVQTRGQGIGRALLEAAVDTARRMGCRQVRLDDPGASAAAQWAQRMGFQKAADRLVREL